jgi:hypothetical protein
LNKFNLIFIPFVQNGEREWKRSINKSAQMLDEGKTTIKLSFDYGLSGCRVKVRQGNSMLLRSFLLSPGMKLESHSNRGR